MDVTLSSTDRFRRISASWSEMADGVFALNSGQTRMQRGASGGDKKSASHRGFCGEHLPPYEHEGGQRELLEAAKRDHPVVNCRLREIEVEFEVPRVKVNMTF